MKKIALVVMLLATSAFAGVNLSIDKTEIAIPPGGTGDVTLSFTTDGIATVIGLYAMADQADAVKIVAFQKLHSSMNEGPAVDPTGMGYFSTDPGAPTGSFGLNGPASGVTVGGDLITLTLETNPDATYPITVTFMGDWSFVDGVNDFWEPLTLTITPEPASMLLLAAGAAFFARRRRA